jgi:hypothetical protein
MSHIPRQGLDGCEGLLEALLGPVEDWSSDEIDQFLSDGGLQTRAPSRRLSSRASDLVAAYRSRGHCVPDQLRDLLDQLRPSPPISPVSRRSDGAGGESRSWDIPRGGPPLRNLWWLRPPALDVRQAGARSVVRLGPIYGAVAATVVLGVGLVLSFRYGPTPADLFSAGRAAPAEQRGDTRLPVPAEGAPTGQVSNPQGQVPLSAPAVTNGRPESGIPSTDVAVATAYLGPESLQSTPPAVKTVVISPSTRTLVVSVSIPRDDYPEGYEAVIETASGAIVGRFPILKPIPLTRDLAAIALTVPVASLRSGNYIVNVKGLRGDGGRNRIGEYALTVEYAAPKAPTTASKREGGNDARAASESLGTVIAFTIVNGTLEPLHVRMEEDLSVAGLDAAFTRRLVRQLSMSAYGSGSQASIPVTAGKYRLSYVTSEDCGEYGPTEVELSGKSSYSIRISCTRRAERARSAEHWFTEGLNATKTRMWSNAVAGMRKAIALNPKESARKVDSSPLRILLGRGTPYLPYYFLGEALFELGDCPGASEAWVTSQRQGFVQKVAEYSRSLQQKLEECSQGQR